KGGPRGGDRPLRHHSERAMIEQIRQVERQAGERIAAAPDLDALRAVDAELLGRRSVLTGLKRELGSLDADERRAAGQALNAARAAVEAQLAARRAELAADERRRQLAEERLDLTEVPRTARRGRLHVVTQTRDRLEDVFVGMGFTVAEGPEVETDWYN